MLKQLLGGAQVNVPAVLTFAALLMLGGALYLPALFAGTPGVRYFDAIQQAWQQVLQKHERKASPEEWAALASNVAALLDETQRDLAPVVASQGIKAPLAQRLLWMVDTETGPTKAKGFLRTALESQGRIDPKVIQNGNSIMSEASALVPRR